MRAIIQRVTTASITINSQPGATIARGFVILLGIEETDTTEDITWLTRKIANLRIFSDDAGHMNHSLADINGDILLVSQFTLYASTKKGNRPSFLRSAKPDIAIPLYEQFIQTLTTETNKPIATGEFGADMQITLTNDGPVTITIDTKNRE
jgi:D-tyrosyl-tRNA(Tyr) deacylase